MTHQTSTHDHIKGLLFGTAYGDALAAPVEFVHDPQQIRAKFPPHGPQDIHSGQVTDDTQLMLAVAEALAATPEVTPSALEGQLRRTFIAWADDPENNRAPGMTCLQATEALKRHRPWEQTTVLGSKGCGANMRVQPLSIIQDQATRAGAAQLQAAMTHGHATALAASDLTAQAIWLVLQGTSPADLPKKLLHYAHDQRHTYHEDWLGTLWRQVPARNPREFIVRGWEETHHALKNAVKAAHEGIPDDADPAQYSGAGWVAEEAFATGLLCFLLHPHDPLRALRRAATTSGDSDSIACITGSLIGAHLGFQAFPPEWAERIEYRVPLHALADELSRHPAHKGA